MKVPTMDHTPDLPGSATQDGDPDPRPDPHNAERIADYLRRYPAISDPERTDLIGGFRQLSNLHIALMLSDPQVAPKLERFRSDHKRETRLPFRDYGALLVLTILCFGLIVYSVVLVPH
jgi:hypothetical protein